MKKCEKKRSPPIRSKHFPANLEGGALHQAGQILLLLRQLRYRKWQYANQWNLSVSEYHCDRKLRLYNCRSNRCKMKFTCESPFYKVYLLRLPIILMLDTRRPSKGGASGVFRRECIRNRRFEIHLETNQAALDMERGIPIRPNCSSCLFQRRGDLAQQFFRRSLTIASRALMDLSFHKAGRILYDHLM